MKASQKNRNRRSPAASFKVSHTRKNIIEDLEEIFQVAMAAGKLNVALKAKELIGKEFGLFLPPSKRTKFSFADLTEDEMQDALEEALTLEAEKRQDQQSLAQEKAQIRTKINAQKDLYAEKQLQREQENREFEEKRRKFYESHASP